MIEFEERGAIAFIRFNNGRLNVYSRELHRRLYGHLLSFLRADHLKVAVMTSAEGTSFSAGDDLKTVNDDYGTEPDWAELVLTLPRDKAIVAAVSGYCLGQGLVYLLSLTDIRYASPDAQFGFPEIKYGMGGAGAITRLRQLIPPTVAMHMVLTGEFMSAADAANCHLVNAVVPAGGLLEQAVLTAEKIAAHPLAALRMEMSPLARTANLSQEEALAYCSSLSQSQASDKGQ